MVPYARQQPYSDARKAVLLPCGRGAGGFCRGGLNP